MERRSFLKMFSGVLAAIPLLRFMPEFKPTLVMDMKHWFRVGLDSVSLSGRMISHGPTVKWITRNGYTTEASHV